MTQERTPVRSYQNQLLVEGRDEELFFGALLRELGINDVQVQNCRGKDNLSIVLLEIAQDPDIHLINSIGIVRDADLSANGAFQSVQSALRRSNLPVPTRMLQSTAGNPSLSVFIMPDNASNGALEQLCLSALVDDPAMPCVEDFLKCISDRVFEPPRDQQKARIHAFLASREDPELRLGEAAQRGYIDWNHPAFAQLSRFLQSL